MFVSLIRNRKCLNPPLSCHCCPFIIDPLCTQMDGTGKFVSGSADRTVRMWTIRGDPLRTFTTSSIHFYLHCVLCCCCYIVFVTWLLAFACVLRICTILLLIIVICILFNGLRMFCLFVPTHSVNYYFYIIIRMIIMFIFSWLLPSYCVRSHFRCACSCGECRLFR